MSNPGETGMRGENNQGNPASEVPGCEKRLARQRFVELITRSEDWLMGRVLEYAKKQDYTRYTCTLAEAWRQSIAGLSAALLEAWQRLEEPPELGPDDDYTQDPMAAFGILEAQQHRARGVSLSMFLGLMKYFRQSYLDLVGQANLDKGYEDHYRLFLDRFFDRVEIGLCMEWSGVTANAREAELQATNRIMTNEKNKYLTIFESLPNPAFFLDADNQVRNMNHAAMELLRGVNLPGGIYYGSECPCPVDTIPFLADDLTVFLAGPETERMVEKSIFTSAGLGYVQIKFQRMLDVSQKYQGTVAILNDLTERQRAAVALRESEERFRLLFHSSNDAVFVHPPVMGEAAEAFVEVNARACQTLGYTREELLQLTPLDLGDPDLRSKFLAIREELWAEKQVLFETEHVAKDGSRIPVEINTRLFIDHGQPLVLSIVRDISRRKAAATALLEAAHKWRTTFDAIRDAVFLGDGENRIIQANQALAELVHQPFSEIINRPCWEVLHHADRPIVDCPLLRMRESRQRETLVLPAGERWLKAAVDPILNDAAEIIGAVHTFTDITDTVNAEKELRHSLEKVKHTLNGTVLALAAMVETRDPYTAGHQRRVAQLASTLAQELGYPDDQVEGMRVIGFLHDIGKIAIPAEVLSRPGKLNDMEFNLIKCHPQAGYDILKSIDFPWPVAKAVHQHHERLDGSGYPLGIVDEDIIPEARILMVADVMEAMASHRPHRPALGILKALEEITQHKGRLYDHAVVEACVRVFAEERFTFI